MDLVDLNNQEKVDRYNYDGRDPYGSRGSKSVFYNSHRPSTSRDPYGSRGSKLGYIAHIEL